MRRLFPWMGSEEGGRLGQKCFPDILRYSSGAGVKITHLREEGQMEGEGVIQKNLWKG